MLIECSSFTKARLWETLWRDLSQEATSQGLGRHWAGCASYSIFVEYVKQKTWQKELPGSDQPEVGTPLDLTHFLPALIYSLAKFRSTIQLLLVSSADTTLAEFDECCPWLLAAARSILICSQRFCASPHTCVLI